MGGWWGAVGHPTLRNDLPFGRKMIGVAVAAVATAHAEFLRKIKDPIWSDDGLVGCGRAPHPTK
jgi:hypothetical protein